MLLPVYPPSKLDIAVMGEQGCGKTSFINAIRGLPDSDPSAGATCCWSTLKEPVKYPIEKAPSISFWDLPPFEKFNFNAQRYLNSINPQRFDLFLLLIDHRVTEDYLAVATELSQHNKRFVLARNKTDMQLQHLRNMSNFNLEHELQNIRLDTTKFVRQSRLQIRLPEIYAISSHELGKYDYENAIECMVSLLMPDQRFLLLMALPVVSDQIIELKQEQLFKCSAAYGSTMQPANPAFYIAEIQKYLGVFGLDQNSIIRLSRKSAKPIAEIYAACSSKFLEMQNGDFTALHSSWDQSTGSTPNILTEAIIQLGEDAKKVLQLVKST
ncbi:hypothetical protein Ciccas_012672 [Cichlidogyrus casuarinus]|uniref:IRG-type G domain-containing protein n=1 Tax=Cichlidogyrus casuarinus TaxID=1844966 RepID=A0ABD2PMS6_9PLAT